MKRIMLFVATVFILGSVSMAIAAMEPDGNHRKGKYLFRKNCRSCHIDGGEAKVLEPATFTMEEWKGAFSDDKVAGYPCKDKWPTEGSDVKDIFTYMYKFAKDSPTPAKCK